MGKYQGWPRPGILSVWLLTVQISTPALLRAGINPIEVLLWSRNKTLVEVEEALQAVRNQRQFDFTKDKGFVLKNKDRNTNEESVPKEVHVHFEDDIKLTCPRRNCTFSFDLPKVTGDWRKIDILELAWTPSFQVETVWRQQSWYKVTWLWSTERNSTRSLRRSSSPGAWTIRDLARSWDLWEKQ